MKKRFPSIILALVLAMGLTIPAFAADTASVTVAGISFDTIVTDKYESYRDSLEDSVAKGYSWAPALLEKLGPIAQYQYHIGLINYGEDDDGVRDFWSYLVKDDVTLDFHLKAGDKITIDGYYLSVGEHKAVDEPVYIADFIGSWTFPANTDGALVDKDFLNKIILALTICIATGGSITPTSAMMKRLTSYLRMKMAFPPHPVLPLPLQPRLLLTLQM